MPTYAFYPAREEQRRVDGLNFAVATAATALAARAAAENLLGEPNALAGWSAVDMTGAPAAFVSGLPVGAKAQTTWPTLGRSGDPMRGT